MTATTSPLLLPARRSRIPSAGGALVLTLLGNILVLGILAASAAGVLLAAALVFGPAIFAAL